MAGTEKLGRIVPDDKFREAVIDLHDFIEAHRLFGVIKVSELEELARIHNKFVSLTRKSDGQEFL